jgi:hypothetical protein
MTDDRREAILEMIRTLNDATDVLVAFGAASRLLCDKLSDIVDGLAGMLADEPLEESEL